jgi:uncharacterized membrane protein YjgN (DUF898 family)
VSYPYQPMYSSYDPSKETTILVLGILSLVVCGLLGPVAWVMGKNQLETARRAGIPDPGMVKAGYICGIISSVLLVFSVVAIVFVFVLSAATTVTRF